jgi:hypothetical protein
MNVQFKKGTYYTFVSSKTVHLGAIEKDLYEGDEFEYDGQTLKLGGAEYNLPNLRAGIRAGWFTPLGEVPLTPATAVNSQQSALSEKLRRPAQTIESDERQVGFATKAARDASVTSREVSVSRVVSDASDEGVTVSRLSVASQQRTVLSDASVANREIRRLDNLTVKAAPSVVASAGDELEELLPEAKSTGKPSPGIAGEGEAARAESVARAEAAKASRLASLAKAPPSKPVQRSEVAALSAAAETSEDDVSSLFGDLLVDDAPEVMDAAQSRMALAQMVVPGFSWDLNASVTDRVATALSKRADPLYLNAILSVETDAVKGQIVEGLRA